MVLAAARATARKATNAISHHRGHNPPGHSARNRLHQPAQVRHASTATSLFHGLGPKPLRSPPHKLFSQTRNLITRLFTQLSAPGARVPTYLNRQGAQTIRSLHSGATPTIKSNLSFHARTALSSGSRNIFLPRPPAPGVRVATNVGLNSARKFSTARPIFQNLVDNVPVIGRTFYEADLDLRKRSAAQIKRKRRHPYAFEAKGKELLKPRNSVIKTTTPQEFEDELSHYFRSAGAPVTTYLFVPIAPTPSSRLPLSPDPILSIDAPNLLPSLSVFAPLHAAHESHATRAASLFRKLDQADVWSQGVKCSAYCQGGQRAGVCTVLRVEFAGWTEAEVRSVTGESGTGWCALEEVWSDEVDVTSDLSSAIDPLEIELEPSSSFVMPTLDFASSCLDSAASTSPSLKSPSLAASSRMSSRPLSPIPDDIFASAMEMEYDDPWACVETSVSTRPAAGPPSESEWSDTSSDRSWQSLGALQFSSQHMNRW